MPSLSSSRKGQFFIVTAVAIATILFFVGRWIEPANIPDTSEIPLKEELFTFDNIREKAVNAVKGSESCDDLNYNLQEFVNFVEDFAREKNYKIDLNYAITPCSTELGAVVEFTLQIISETTDTSGAFSVTWP